MVVFFFSWSLSWSSSFFSSLFSFFLGRVLFLFFFLVFFYKFSPQLFPIPRLASHACSMMDTSFSFFFLPCLIPVFRGLATLAAEPELAVILVLDCLNQVQRQTLENLWKKEDWHCLGAAQSYWIYHMMSIFLTDLFPHKGLSPIGPYFHITTVYSAEICISSKIGYPVCAPHPAIIRFTHLFIKHILQQTYFCSKVNEIMYEKTQSSPFPDNSLCGIFHNKIDICFLITWIFM